MARAALPEQLPLDPFFVLRWDPDVEDMSVIVDVRVDDSSDLQSYSLGDYLPGVSRALQFQGLDPLFADRAVDAAREFRAVQVIPRTSSVIPLIQRTLNHDPVIDMLAQQDQEQQTSYAHL